MPSSRSTATRGCPEPGPSSWRRIPGQGPERRAQLGDLPTGGPPSRDIRIEPPIGGVSLAEDFRKPAAPARRPKSPPLRSRRRLDAMSLRFRCADRAPSRPIPRVAWRPRTRTASRPASSRPEPGSSAMRYDRRRSASGRTTVRRWMPAPDRGLTRPGTEPGSLLRAPRVPRIPRSCRRSHPAAISASPPVERVAIRPAASAAPPQSRSNVLRYYGRRPRPRGGGALSAVSGERGASGREARSG